MNQTEELELHAEEETAEKKRQDFERLLNMPRIKEEDVTPTSLMFDPLIGRRLQLFAEMLSQGKVSCPDHLRGNIADCLAVVMQASQWKMNPFAVAQKTHLVGGTLGYEAQLVNAVISSNPLLSSRIAYEWEGDWLAVNGKTDKDDSHAVTVSASIRGEVGKKELRVSMAQVGPVRNSPLWFSDPRQQLAYLAIKKWARLYTPDVLLGVYTPDELEEETSAQVSETSNDIMNRARQIKQQKTVVDTSKPEPDDEADEWPQKGEDGILRDANGIPWSADFHSQAKTCNDDGSWRRRRGVHPDAIKEYEAKFISAADDDTGPAQDEHRTVTHGPTEQDMRERIKRSTGTEELDRIIEQIGLYESWQQVVRDDLTQLAEQYRADWFLVEQEEREKTGAAG